MGVGYLEGLSGFFQGYGQVLVYGAGGVTRDLMRLIGPCLGNVETHIAVSEKEGDGTMLDGHPVREITEFCAAREQAYVVVSAMPRHACQMEAHLKELGFPNYCMAADLVGHLYQEIWETPVQKNKIILANGDGYGFGGNPKYIARKLLESGEKLDLVWVLDGGDAGSLPAGVRTVQYGTYEHYRELGTARVWVDNQHKNFFTRKREGQAYIQTWHGGGPLKKIEFDAEDLPASYLDLCELNSGMEDIMVSPSSFNSRLYREAFHYGGEILECGYPRNDIFWTGDGCREKMESTYGVRPGEGILLYAPTYRESRAGGEDVLDLGRARSAMEKKFGKKYRVFVRFHPFDKEPEKRYGWDGEWVNVTAYPDVQELLAASDILVTDYSSIMWDFSLQKKPVFLFHPDLLRYREERGYYLPFDKMPYAEAFDNAGMEAEIGGFCPERYQRKLEAFLEEYGSFDRGTASEEVAGRILGLVAEGGE